MPVWPLLATLAVQTLATMSLYSVPTVAPKVAHDLGVHGTLVGGFVATAYGVGILSALISPGLVRRYGGVRATQVVLLAAAGMLLLAGLGQGVTSLALAAVVLGLGYGAAAPASTHLLVPHTPRPVFNLVMSLRQIGVPLGGVLAALILPPLTLAIGWRGALLVEVVPVLLLAGLMEIPRRRWDEEREPERRAFGRTLIQPFALLRDQRFRRLSMAAFVYSGLALCMVAFMTEQLTRIVGMDLVRAGQMLAAYQIAGSASRPVWGWVADRLLTPAHGRDHRAVRAGLAVLGNLSQRHRRWLYFRRLHRCRLCRVCRAGRNAPHRSDGVGHRDHVFRRHGRAAAVRRLGRRVGCVSRKLPGRRDLRAGGRCAAGTAAAVTPERGCRSRWTGCL